MDTKEQLEFQKEEVAQSTTLIVHQLQNVQDKDFIELSKLPFEQRLRIKNFIQKELTEDVRDNAFAVHELEESIKQIEERH